MRAWTTLGLLACLLAGCAEEAPPAAESAARPAPPDAATATWLSAHDPADPAPWLLLHARRQHPSIAATPEAVTALLGAAAERYRESPRMIANRAVQLQTMLDEEGIGEDAVTLLAALAQLPPVNRVSFSADCQHYYNLRTQGLDHAQALARLAAA